MEVAEEWRGRSYPPGVNSTLGVAPANAGDAHRPLEQHHGLAAILSHVEKHRVKTNYAFLVGAKTYRIVHTDICAGLGGSCIRVEQ